MLSIRVSQKYTYTVYKQVQETPKLLESCSRPDPRRNSKDLFIDFLDNFEWCIAFKVLPASNSQGNQYIPNNAHFRLLLESYHHAKT